MQMLAEVWFQNRRSKERRMKNSNSLGARRNFLRSASRRIRVPNTPTAASQVVAGQQAGGGVNGQQSLIATGNGGVEQRNQQQAQGQQPQTQQAQQGQQQQQQQSTMATNRSPSGTFAYFSDSSNQGDAFSMGPATGQYITGGEQPPPPQLALDSPRQQQQQQHHQQQQQPQYRPAVQAPPPPPQQASQPQSQAAYQHHHAGYQQHQQQQPPHILQHHHHQPAQMMMQSAPSIGGAMVGHIQWPI